jgi:ribosome biogenesis GTPase
VRPSPSSRPRTRRRPTHADAIEGFVITVDRGRYTCFIEPDTFVTAMRARELGRRGVVVGDHVQIVGDVSGRPDTLARIVRIDERDSVLMRTADDEEGDAERVVVANAEQLVIVSSLADPPPRTGFIDRCLVAAYDAEIDPLLCLTKADIATRADAHDVLDYYAELDLPHVLTRPDEPLTALLAELTGRVSVLIGHSGVGKSTLVNRLVPDAARAVGVVSAVGKGRHTSTSVLALRLPDEDGWIIDTPGVRSFGLAHVSADSLLHGFPDLVEASTRCPANCDHTGAGGTCGLDKLVAEGGADPRRLASFRRLLASRSGTVEDDESQTST